MDIGAKIKAVRESKRITQVEIAESLGVDNSYYAKMEKRGNKLTFEQVQKIADYLDVSLIDLVNYDSEKGLSVPQDYTQRIKELAERINELEENLSDKNELLKAKKDLIKDLREFITYFSECVQFTQSVEYGLVKISYDGKERVFNPDNQSDWEAVNYGKGTELLIDYKEIVELDVQFLSKPLYKYLAKFILASDRSIKQMHGAIDFFLDSVGNRIRFVNEELFSESELESESIKNRFQKKYK